MKARRPLKITSRTSSITNSFVQAILPAVMPTEAELGMVLAALGMTKENRCCAYCGERATDWDHLRPLVKSKKPTGFLNEAMNLVPCCGPCNQSKSGANWRAWMEKRLKNSQSQKFLEGAEKRMAALEAFERQANLEPFPFEQVVGTRWHKYWSALEEIESKMREAQKLADEIREVVEIEYRQRFRVSAGNASSR